jgi:hypothetical protein
VQDSAGGKTQIVSIISAILIAIVLIFIGPLFQPLPLVLNRIGRSFFIMLFLSRLVWRQLF